MRASIGLTHHRLERLGAVMQNEVDRSRVPGAVVLISRHGQVAYFESFGRRDAVAGAPMTRDAIFRIYSMTKPITSVAAMMLWEEGRFILSDPLSKYLPELSGLEVAIPRGNGFDRAPLEREATIHDLLRHTSGFTYEFLGAGPVHKLYASARLNSRSQSSADQVASLAKLPLVQQPGTRWEYSRSTDVLGRLIEIVSGLSLGEYLERCILGPLGMADTAFHIPEHKHSRIAEPFAKDPDSGGTVQLLDIRSPPRFESGGGGLVSTASDYARFLQMLCNGGELDDVRYLSRKTIDYMTTDHLGSITGSPDLLLPGYGFGLGFAVRRDAGIAQTPGSVGEYFWGGLAGTTFWVDPAEALFAILLVQAPGQREYYHGLIRNLVYAAIAD